MAEATVKCKEYLHYPFTEEETREIAKNLALSVTLREHAARMNCVLHLTAKAAAIPQAVAS